MRRYTLISEILRGFPMPPRAWILLPSTPFQIPEKNSGVFSFHSPSINPGSGLGHRRAPPPPDPSRRERENSPVPHMGSRRKSSTLPPKPDRRKFGEIRGGFFPHSEWKVARPGRDSRETLPGKIQNLGIFLCLDFPDCCLKWIQHIVYIEGIYPVYCANISNKVAMKGGHAEHGLDAKAAIVVELDNMNLKETKYIE